MKMQTFGTSNRGTDTVHDPSRHSPIYAFHTCDLYRGTLRRDEFKSWDWSDQTDGYLGYKKNRSNGIESDSPARAFPFDGIYTWDTPNARQSKIRYTEGPEDKKWMEERDRNYVFRLEREGRLDQVEPNLRTENPVLYTEVIAARSKPTTTPVAAPTVVPASSSPDSTTTVPAPVPPTPQPNPAKTPQQEQAEKDRLEKEKILKEKKEAEERAEKLADELQKLKAQQAPKMKKQTFGISFDYVRVGYPTYYFVQNLYESASRCTGGRGPSTLFSGTLKKDEFLAWRWGSNFDGCVGYKENRLNGTEADSPSRPFPQDGIYTLDTPSANGTKLRYTEGPLDHDWMAERDRNYVFRLEREGRLDQEEPNLSTENPALYAEVIAARSKTKPETVPTTAAPTTAPVSSSSTTTTSPTPITLPKKPPPPLPPKLQPKVAPTTAPVSSPATTTTVPPRSTPPPQVQPNPATISPSWLINFADLQFGKELGEGGFGIVFQGKWQGAPVAIKTLKLTAMSQEAKEDFIKEAQIMANLRHPNIVSMYGVCMTPSYNLVMEYMPRGSLYSVLHSQEQLNWTMRWSIASDIAKGMLCLHSHNPCIVHRDLKSLNVLLDVNYRAKVADFGLSKVKIDTQITSSGGQVGTLRWMAPDLFNTPNAPYTRSCDVYSLGVIFWEIASRKIPWDNMGIAFVGLVIQGQREEVPADTPPSFAKLISSCWHKRSQDRPTMAEILTELEDKKDEASQMPNAN